MLHDLYLLSCYFDPAQAAQSAAALEKRYGAGALRDALRAGFVEFCGALPCERGHPLLCRLSRKGLAQFAREPVVSA